MTISSETRRAGPFIGSGVIVAYPFAFKVFEKTDLRIVRAIIATGVTSDLVLDSDYSVTLNVDQNSNPGGSVAYLVAGVPTALPVTDTLTIVGNLPFLQETDITNGGGFYPDVIEDAFDRVVMLTQQTDEKVERALQLDVATDPAFDATLPAPVANEIIGWGPDGLSLVNFSADTTVSADVLRADLASTADLAKGDTLIGVKHTVAGAVARTQHQKNHDYVSVADFGVVGDGVANDTAAMAAAIAAAEIGSFALHVPGGFIMRIAAELDVPPNLRIVGEGAAIQASPRFMAVGGVNIFAVRSGFGSESTSFENLQFDSDTAGTGAAFFGDTTSYLAQTTFRNCTFRSNLRYGINASIILARFYDCDFGSYPGTVQTFSAIRSIGTVGTFEPNANSFFSCVFRKSSALYQIDWESYGAQWNFYACDFEQNACTIAVIRADASGSINFFGGYMEANTSPYVVRTIGNLASGFVNVVRIHGVHVNNPATIAIVKRDIIYPFWDIQGCYGQLNCNVTDNDAGVKNLAVDMEACFGNYWVAGTGSFGELSTINTSTGYNGRRVRAKLLQADAIEGFQVNAAQKLAVSVTAATDIATMSASLDAAAGNWSGMIHVMAMAGSSLVGAGAANTASYSLLVSNGGVTQLTQIGANGVTGGAAANQPSFTWSIGAGGALRATPIGSTSGTFSFLISCSGGVKAA